MLQDVLECWLKDCITKQLVYCNSGIRSRRLRLVAWWRRSAVWDFSDGRVRCYAPTQALTTSFHIFFPYFSNKNASDGGEDVKLRLRWKVKLVKLSPVKWHRSVDIHHVPLRQITHTNRDKTVEPRGWVKKQTQKSKQLLRQNTMDTRHSIDTRRTLTNNSNP